MLTIIWGLTGSGKTKKLLDTLTGPEGGVFLTPEPFSHESERLLAQEGDDVCLRAEALTFTRLAHRVLAEEGGLARPTLDAGGRILLLYLAMREVEDKLHVLKGKREHALLPVLQTIDELKCYCVSPEALGQSGEGKPKLQDIALLYAAYEALCAQSSADPRDLLTHVGDLMSKGAYAKGKRFFLDGFTSFTAQEYRILEACLQFGADMTIALTGWPAARAPEDARWEQAQQCARRLTAIAGRYGIRVMENVLPGGRAETIENVTLGEALTAREECEWAASLIQKWVREDNKRFRDIGVVSPQWDMYAGLLASVFDGENISVNWEDKEDLRRMPLPALVISALHCVQYGFQQEDILALLKTGFSGLSASDCDKLENYILATGVKGIHWTTDKPWTAVYRLTPYHEKERETQLLKELNTLRVQMRRPLMRLREGTAGTRPAQEMASALFRFLEDINLAQSLTERTERLSRMGELPEAERTRQVWRVLCRILDSFVDTLGTQTLTLADFSALLSLMLGQYELGNIPVALDRVSAGGLERRKRRSLTHLIVLGATDEAMPRRSESAGLLTDEDRVFLEGKGLELGPNADQRSSREWFMIYRTLATPTEALVMSFARANETAQPSSVMLELAKRFAPPVRIRARRRAVSANTEKQEKPEKLSPCVAQKLYGKTLSPSQVEKFASCRFSYFCQYGLKAQPREIYGFHAADTGTLVHMVLRRFVRAVMERGGFQACVPREADRLLRGLTAEIRPRDWERRGERFRRLFDRLLRACVRIGRQVADEMRTSAFAPLDTEAFIGGQDGVPLPGSDFRLKGIADRVDGWTHNGNLYLRVVDYKTGPKNFQLRDVWYGLNVQLLTYLFSLSGTIAPEKYGARQIVPAGALYLPAREPLLTVPKNVSDEEISREMGKLLTRSGILLDDPAVLEAMEKPSPTGKRTYLPVSLNRDGSFSALSQVASAARLNKLWQHVETVLRDMGDALGDGSMDANPIYRHENDHACLYCDFQAACHFDKTRDHPRRLYALSSQAVWDRLEGGVSHDRADE